MAFDRLSKARGVPDKLLIALDPRLVDDLVSLPVPLTVMLPLPVRQLQLRQTLAPQRQLLDDPSPRTLAQVLRRKGLWRVCARVGRLDGGNDM